MKIQYPTICNAKYNTQQYVMQNTIHNAKYNSYKEGGKKVI